jgi:hypothetical protein
MQFPPCLRLFNVGGMCFMKTLRKVEIIPVFVEFIPDTLKQDLVYISKEYKTAVHLCLCGCGNLAVTPLNANGWTLTERDGKVSFTPSILNNNCPNRYHYIITNNVANVC